MNNRPTGIDDIHFVDPNAVRDQLGKYSGLLAKVLAQCYGIDYPGTSLDTTSNQKNILNRTQRSVFWAVTDQEWLEERLGTSSMVNADEEFGPGYAEMGKSGSLGDGNAKLGYMRFINEWNEGKNGLGDFDSLVTTVRNCPERLGKEFPVKSGVGIRVIFLKYLQFQQWGIAPWLLMPDDSEGSYEILDLLFKHRNDHQVANAISSTPVSLVGDENRDLLNQFARFNYGINVQLEDAQSSTGTNADSVIGWKLLVPPEKASKNPIKMVPYPNGDTDFNAVFKQMNGQSGAMNTIYLPLIPQTTDIQDMLSGEGWVLTGFIPGKKDGSIEIPFKGMWSKLTTKRPLIRPHYIDNADELSPDWYKAFVERSMYSLKS